MTFRKQNRLDLGRIARELKPLYLTTGQRESGKGWEAFLEARGLEDRTVDRWILDYECSAGIRPPQSVRDNLSRTNAKNKGDSSDEPSEAVVTNPTAKSEPDLGEISSSPEAGRWIDAITSKDRTTPEGRSNLLYTTAVNLFGCTGDRQAALSEWDAVSARVRNYLVAIQITPEEKVNHGRRETVEGLE